MDLRIRNVDRALLIASDPARGILALDALKTKYGFEPDGTIGYYGLCDTNVNVFNRTGSALSAKHQAAFKDLVAWTTSSAVDEKTFILGLEPLERERPYAYVADNLDLVHQLAVELAAVQQTVRASGKRLTIVIRYASEMNDAGQKYGNQPRDYVATYVAVRTIFAARAPDVLFSFSPAIRADLRECDIAQYWPGGSYVDIIGGTWYIGSREQRARSVANLQAYFLHRRDAEKPFALSELGGRDSDGTGNDAVLADMLSVIADLQQHGIRLAYATLFLVSTYGTDSTLAFLSSQPGAFIASTQTGVPNER